jgi:hypothetical protein
MDPQEFSGTAAANHNRRAKLIEWSVKVVLVLFGLALGLVGFEIGLRIINRTPAGSQFESLADLRSSILRGGADDTNTDPKRPVTLANIILPHSNDQIIYDLKPRHRVTFQGVRTETNSCGMRWPEMPLKKPKDTYRIAFLGDSFAFGWGVKVDESFPKVLEETLNRVSRGRPKFEVLNFGVPGYSTFQQVALFKERGLDFDPDAVIVFFVENDFGMPFFIRDHRDSSRLMDSMTFSRLDRSEFESEAEDGYKVPAYDPSRALRELAEISSDRGIQVHLAINPRKKWGKIRNRLWVLKERGDINVMPLIDDLIFSIQARQIPENTLQLATDPHPSAVKHHLLGEIMAPFFLPVIESQSR